MTQKSILLCAVALIGLPCPALAAQAPGASAAPDAAATESDPPPAPEADEILVTARRRQESILKVPVVESVVGADLIQRAQIIDLKGIASRVPGLALGSQVLTIGTQISIRGIGTSTLDAGVDQSVALNIDGLQQTQGLAFQAAVFDMAQVEVLKGPQALFFGKNSPAGVIAIQTADPGDRFELIGRLGYEVVANETRGEVILSGPATDTLGLRLATSYSDFQGFFRNSAIGDPSLGGVDPEDRRFGETKALIVRGTAVWKPATGFKARLKLNYSRDRNIGGTPQQLVSCPDGTGPIPGSTRRFIVNDDCRLNRQLAIASLDPAAFPGVPNGGKPYFNNTQKFGTLDLSYDLDPALNLSSTTGYYKLRGAGLINGTTLSAGSPLASANFLSRRDTTQELRLTSDFGGPLNFMLGAYYQDGRVSNRLSLPGNRRLLLPASLGNNRATIDIEALSFFGQVRWRAVRNVEIAGGVRWTDEKRGYEAQGFLTGTAVPILLADPADPFNVAARTFNPKIRARNWSPELSVTYTPTDDLTIFGSLKQGYKSGSFSISRVLSTGVNPAFGDEKVQGGELGLKARTEDRALLVNVAGYYYKYKGLQVGVSTPVGGIPQNLTLNAGAARVYGVDFDVTYNVPAIEDMRLRGAINWNRARFTELEQVPCWGGQTIAEGCNQSRNPNTGFFTAQSLTGTRPVRAPDWQVTAGADHDVPIGDGMVVRIGADGQYSSKYPALLGRRSDFFQHGFAKINANLALRGPDGAWELSLIGNNLTNKLTYGNCSSINAQNGQVFGGYLTGSAQRGPAGIDEVACRVDRGRELWTRLSVRF